MRLLAFLAFILLAQPAWAATLCLDASATDADNTCCTSSDSCATCDSGDPCDTIQEAADAFGAGADTLLVAPGIYTNEMVLNGTADNDSTITCTGTVANRCYLEGWTEVDSSLWTVATCSSANDCWFNSGSTGISTGSNWWDNWLWIDGVPGTLAGFPAKWVGCDVATPDSTGTACAEDETSIDEPWEFFYKQDATIGNRGVYLRTDGTDPSTHRIFEAGSSTEHGFDLNSANDVRIDGPWVIQGFKNRGISIGDSDDTIVRGTEAAPIIFNFNGRTKCDLNGCTAPNIDILGTCAGADTNYSSGADFDWVESRYSGRGGVRVHLGAKDATFTDMTVLGADLHPPFDAEGTCDDGNAQVSGITFEDSTATKSTGCIQLLNTTNSIARRIRCTDPATKTWGGSTDTRDLHIGTQDAVANDALDVSATIDGLLVVHGAGQSGPMIQVNACTNCTIKNSTFVGGDSTDACLDVQSTNGSASNPTTGFTFTNNICAGELDDRVIDIGSSASDATSAGVTFTNNLYDTTQTFAARVIDNGSCSGTCTYATFAAWKSGQSQDSTSINDAADLTDGVPSAQSPAVNASTTATTFDVLSTTIRPRGTAPDIGAYEVWPGNSGNASRVP